MIKHLLHLREKIFNVRFQYLTGRCQMIQISNIISLHLKWVLNEWSENKDTFANDSSKNY